MFIAERFCFRHANVLLERSYLSGLASLFHGSVEHCLQVTQDDVHNLAEAIGVLADPRMTCWSRGDKKPRTSLMLISDICTLLTPILLYSLPSVSLALLNEEHLLIVIPTIIQSLFKTQGVDKTMTKTCARFYTQFVQSKCKQEKLDDSTDDEEDERSFNSEITETSIDSPVPFNFSEDLILSYFDLYRQIRKTSIYHEKSAQQEQIQRLIKEEWEKLDTHKLHHDYEQLKNEHISLKEELSELRDQLQRTQSERDQFRKENKKMAQEIDNLKLVPTTGTAIESQQSSSPVSVGNDNQENTIDELKSLSPHEITSEQAEQCIREIYRRRTTFNDHDMRQSICGSLKHLGSDLYSSPVHFLHELIQVVLFYLLFLTK